MACSIEGYANNARHYSTGGDKRQQHRQCSRQSTVLHASVGLGRPCPILEQEDTHATLLINRQQELHFAGVLNEPCVYSASLPPSHNVLPRTTPSLPHLEKQSTPKPASIPPFLSGRVRRFSDVPRKNLTVTFLSKGLTAKGRSRQRPKLKAHERGTRRLGESDGSRGELAGSLSHVLTCGDYTVNPTLE